MFFLQMCNQPPPHAPGIRIGVIVMLLGQL
jgi:hypothetical protein